MCLIIRNLRALVVQYLANHEPSPGKEDYFEYCTAVAYADRRTFDRKDIPTFQCLSSMNFLILNNTAPHQLRKSDEVLVN